MTKLSEIEDISAVHTAKLEVAGIISLEHLLSFAFNRKGRKALSNASGISEELLLHWVNRADLSRVKGISFEYADLLEVAGIETAPELAKRNPENLYLAMSETNDQKMLVSEIPSINQLQDWVSQAKNLPRVVVC